MAKPELILTSVDADDEVLLNSGSSMQNGVVTITKTLYFRVPPGENPRQYNDLDVYSHPLFPQVNSALSQDARYKFYGNAKITRDNNGYHQFFAELEYSTENPNAKDANGNTVTADTPPWKLRPENISFDYPELSVPFLASYDTTGRMFYKTKTDIYGNPIEKAYVAVQNTAGTPLILETTKKNVQLEFTFAARKWDPNYSLVYGNTVNSADINVCGIKIPAGMGLLYPPKAEYITTYEDNSTRIKWQYWQVKVSILIDVSGTAVFTRVANLGDRAIFDAQSYTDALITTAITLPATGNTGAEQICRFRKYIKTTLSGGKYQFTPLGDSVFCSWNQFLAFRQKAISLSSALAAAKTGDPNYTGGTLDPQCEQLDKMPLDDNGKLDTQGIADKNYLFLYFRKYPLKSWSGLNLPKKGVDW